MSALRRAIVIRRPPAGLIHHADRGSRPPSRACCWPTRAMTATPYARGYSSTASCWSSRRARTAPDPSPAMIANIRIATASSACSTVSSSSAASPPATTRLPAPSSPSSIWPPPSAGAEGEGARRHGGAVRRPSITPLALQLRSGPDVSFSGCGLVSAPPQRPSDHMRGLNLPLRQAHRHAPDLLYRPADQSAG